MLVHTRQSPEEMRAIAADPAKYGPDQSTYAGRLQYCLDLISPTWWLSGLDRMEDARALLDRVHNKAAGFEYVPVEAYWHARRLNNVAFHPQTREPLPLALRLDGWVPLLAFTTSITAVAASRHVALNYAAHTIQQAYIASVNGVYANRATPLYELSVDRVRQDNILVLGTGMLCATLTAGAAAHSPNVVVAGIAGALAAAVNVAIIRHAEVTEGVPTKDASSGSSEMNVTAGGVAVAQTAITRAAVLGLNALLVPLVARRVLQYIPSMSSFAGTFVSYGVSSALVLSAVTPLAFAAFPLHGKLSQGKGDSDLRFYRGL